MPLPRRTGGSRSADALVGLLTACHPLPCLAVTAFSAAWAWRVGLAVSAVATVAFAVLLGQLSIGWSNDALDAVRDTRAARADKPIPRGLVGPRTVAVAAVLAALACVPASLALGRAPGIVHLVAVGSGWAYNAGLKRRWASPLPYAVSFGLLPAVVQTWPPLGVMAGTALLGVAAHFANTVADTEADAATGVRGLPQRLGPHTSLRVCAVSLVGAAVTLALTSGRTAPAPLVLYLLGAAAAVALAGFGLRLGRWAFRALVAAVALVLAAFLLGG